MPSSSSAKKEWTRIFPYLITENYTNSLQFMKQLTVIVISTVVYLKNIFPEENYSLEKLGGIQNLRILKKDCSNEIAKFLSNALIKAFEAIEKKYLHQLVLCFYKDECKMENLIEFHLCKYSYESGGPSVSVRCSGRSGREMSVKCTFDTVREQTLQLLQTYILMMRDYQPAPPSNCDISVRLYYNEDAPEDYQAPGYISAPLDDENDNLTSLLQHTFKVGSVRTPFHKLATSFFIKECLIHSNEATASENPPVMTQWDTFTDSVTERESDLTDVVLRCPCNKKNLDEPFEHTTLLRCRFCHTNQHASCYGLLPEQIALVDMHCCIYCYNEDPSRRPTDPTMVSMTSKSRQFLCLFRRTLYWCSKNSIVTVKDLMTLGFRHVNATKIVHMLWLRGIIANDATEEDTPQSIDSDKLKQIMSKYFKVAEGQDIVNQLLSETFSSQESQPDPVGDTLSALEKGSLQSASTLGRVIEPSKYNQPTSVDDAALREYTEALQSASQDKDTSTTETPVAKTDQAMKRKINHPEKPALRYGVRSKAAKMEPK